MIQFSDVQFKYTQDDILNHLNLTVAEGKCVVLAGKSGSGKSTILHLLNGLIPELYPGTLNGEINVMNQKLPLTDFNNYLLGVAVVFQNPNTQYFTSTVFSELAFTLENLGVDHTQIELEIQKVSQKFKLKDLLDKKIETLSGGEKQRVTFAAISMLDRPLYLFDEPSSNLDEAALLDLQTFIRELKQAGKTVVIVDHRLLYLKNVADEIIILEDGKLKECLSLERLTKCTTEEMNELGLRSLVSNVQTVQPYSKKTISTSSFVIEDLTYDYDKKHDFHLDILSCELFPGEIVGIVGANGSGKTTFSHLICGLLKSKTGTFTLDKRSLKLKDLLRQSFLVRQDVHLQLFFETVEKELMIHSKTEAEYQHILTKLNLTHLLKRHPQTLSGGEKQRLAIATALLSNKKVLIFDEPTSGLDFESMKQVTELFNWLKSMDLYILVISHDTEFLAACANRQLTFEKGNLRYDEQIIRIC